VPSLVTMGRTGISCEEGRRPSMDQEYGHLLYMRDSDGGMLQAIATAEDYAPPPRGPGASRHWRYRGTHFLFWPAGARCSPSHDTCSVFGFTVPSLSDRIQLRFEHLNLGGLCFLRLSWRSLHQVRVFFWRPVPMNTLSRGTLKSRLPKLPRKCVWTRAASLLCIVERVA
jgi:hypothetical protein